MPTEERTNELAKLREGLLLQYVDVTENDPTPRVQLWCPSHPTEHFLGWLDTQCDVQGVVGVEGIITPVESDGSFRLLLLVDEKADLVVTASMWISGVNMTIRQLPEAEVARLTAEVQQTEAVSADGARDTEFFVNQY